MTEGNGHREHRWPRQERTSFPACFVLWYSWRRIVLFTPKVRLRAWQIIVSTLCRGPWLIGLYVGLGDDDDEPVVRFGLGFVEVEVNTIRFYSDAEMEASYGA